MAENVTAYNVKIVMSAVGTKKTTDEVKKTKEEVNKLGESAKKASTKIGELWNSLKRIAMYRLLRTAIKGVTSSIKEGISNLKEWSRLNDGRFYSSMERLSSAVLTIKNSLAVAFAPLIENVIVPLVEKLANAFVVLSNNISMFAARLKGETKYLGVATSAMNKYAAAQRSLLGFDELNKLNGGKSDTDYNGMFAYYDMPETSFGIKLADFFIDSSEIDSSVILGRLTAVFAGITGGIIGWSIGGPKGALTGVIAGVAISLLLSSLGFNDETGISYQKAGQLFINALPVLTAILGWKLGGVKGAVFGAAIGVSLRLLLGDTKFQDATGLTPARILGMLLNTLTVATTTLGLKIGGAQGALVGAALGIALTFLIKNTDIFDGTELTRKGMAALLIGAFSTILTAGLAMTALGAAGGALIGIMVGVTLTFMVMQTGIQLADGNVFDKVKTDLKSMWDDTVSLFTGKGGTKLSSTLQVDAVSGAQKETTMFGDNWKDYDPDVWYADGGYPKQGSMFIAGEAGPELVASIGGRTGVYNTDQLGGALAGANEMIVDALYQVAGTITNAIANQPVPSIKIGDREIYQASQRGSKVMGSSLVQGV